MIEIKHLDLQRGHSELLKNVSITLPDHKRIGFIGKNGTGKSSFFALLLGELLPDKGDIAIPAHTRFSIIKQETPTLECSALNYVLMGDNKRLELYLQLDQALQQDNSNQIGLIHQQLEDIDAYSAPARAAKLLSGLGFTESQHQQAVKSFSGGWRMRLNLAQALLSPAEILLLDEPTNHLDLETVIWLEDYLCRQSCTQIIISHDKDFLNSVTNTTLELAQQQLTLYGGNYEFYQKEKILRLSQQQALYSKQQTHIKHLQSFVDRFRYKASKAKQAQSRIKVLEKLERLAPAQYDSEFNFQFYPVGNLPNPLIKLEGLVIGYNEPLTKEINLSIEGGARIGLLGVNGSGKSTLIKTIVGQIPAISGAILRAEKIKIAYFAQHQLDYLIADASPIYHIQQLSPNETEFNIRTFLANFNFKNDKVYEPITHFSGGEKARLALAVIVWQKPNFLLLDEPTNHLDIDMRNSLIWALQSFAGAMILISHDRNLLESSCDNFIFIENQELHLLNGDLEDYRLMKLAKSNNTQLNKAETTDNHKQNKKLKAQLRQEITQQTKSLNRTINDCEKQIKNLEDEKQVIETFLANPDSYHDKNKAVLQQYLIKAQEIKQDLTTLEELWLSTQQQIETIQTDLIQQFKTE